LPKKENQNIFLSTYGETELTNDDRVGLKLSNILTKQDLDIAEYHNIEKASKSLLNCLLSNKTILDYLWLKNLHELMFGDVWEWAGKYRIRETNIGSDPAYIARDFKVLCDDVKVWVEFNTYPIIEMIVRFHHLLLKIHPFPNGNGRWARLACMCLANANGLTINWSELSILENKKEYIEALRYADIKNDYQKLLVVMSRIFI
jgi:Fic-DOC domain mobile mystery protein B